LTTTNRPAPTDPRWGAAAGMAMQTVLPSPNRSGDAFPPVRTTTPTRSTGPVGPPAGPPSRNGPPAVAARPAIGTRSPHPPPATPPVTAATALQSEPLNSARDGANATARPSRAAAAASAPATNPCPVQAAAVALIGAQRSPINQQPGPHWGNPCGPPGPAAATAAPSATPIFARQPMPQRPIHPHHLRHRGNPGPGTTAPVLTTD
jgi:hypothetical protein